MLLGRLTGRDDVVFGVTVAGRPAEIAGIETMVGLFINTVPLRVRVPPEKPVLALLRGCRRRQSRLLRAPASGADGDPELQPDSGELFDTLVVFENYPLDRRRRFRRTRVCGCGSVDGR